MKAVYGKGCMDVKNVRKWVWRARSCCAGEMSVWDKHRPGQPISVTCDKNQCRVDAMVQENRRMKQRDIDLKLGISQERVRHIIETNYRKVCAWWVLRQLTDPMKEHRNTVAQELLNRYRLEGDDFLKNIATGDESCVHHYDPENKRQSMEYCHPGSPSVKKFRTVQSAKKVMLTIFWDARGVLYTEFLTKGSTMNFDRYCETLQSLKQHIRRIRPERNMFLLHQNNARPHCSAQTQDATASLKFTVVPHPPYSPDLAPSDFWLFAKLKEMLKGQHFSSDAEVGAAVRKWISSQPETFFMDGMNKWIERLKKCVAVNGDCVEK